MRVLWRLVLGVMVVSFWFVRLDIDKFIGGIDKFVERHTSHEKLASVLYHGEWSLGEYRECISANLKTEGKDPHLDCTDSLSSGVDKVFNVAFSGDLTYDNERPEKVIHRWLCRRNGGDPTFSCSAKETPTEPQATEDTANPVEHQLTDAEIENLHKRYEYRA